MRFLFSKKRIVLVCLLTSGLLIAAGCGRGAVAPSQTGAEQAKEAKSEKAPPPNPIGGKTVEIVVPFAPGGSFDVTCRLVAPYLEKALEKITGVDQTVIVVNKPGASGKVAYEDIYREGPDAPRFVLMSASAIPQQAGMKTNYDVTKFTYLGRASVDYRAIYLRKELPINSFKELVDRSQKKPILIGTSGFGASEHQNALMMSDILKKDVGIDLRFDYVHFKGAGDIQAALMKGDVEGSINSIPDTLVSVRGGYGKVIVQVAPKRTEMLPDVPTLIESGVPEKVSAKIQNVLMQKRSFVASPNMNRALADLLRKALKEALSDPELLAKAKQSEMTIDYGDPESDLQNSKDTLEAMSEFKDLLSQMYK